MRLPLLALCVLAGGCVHYPLPMTADDLVRYNTGPALVVYLGQPDASPSVCDPRSQSPHLPELPPEMQEALVAGLVDGKIQPDLWSRCARALARGLPEDQAASLFDLQAGAYRDLLLGSKIEGDPAVDERVATLQRLYLDRRGNRAGHPEVVGEIVDDLRTRLERNKLGSVARSFGRELVATVDLEKGRWQGRPVNVALLDELAATGNEMTLTRFAERLPDPALRAEASRRIVRVHIALSPFPEVRAAAPAVEETVLATGHNPISLADHPFVRAWFDWDRTPMRGVLVRQSVWSQTATLLGYAPDRLALSVLPELSFRDALWVELGSISRPVSLCGAKRELDPTPCVDVTDVTLENPLAYLDRRCAFHLRDNVAMAGVLPFATQEAFAVPVRIGGRPAATLQWGLTFARPDDLVFIGPTPGGDGPSLSVRVERPLASRVVFTASAPAGTFAAVVEDFDLGGYHVASVGARGFTGASGFDGSSGSSGFECSDGGRGGDGGPGGVGGPGGNGGDVLAEIACAEGDCAELVARVGAAVRSDGGPGGAGGSGGRGGSGGSGGSGRSATTHTDDRGFTVVDDPGCSPGSSGASGSDGPDGAPGRPGWPGRVTIRVVR